MSDGNFLQDIERLERDLYKEEEAKTDLQNKLRQTTNERDLARKLAKTNEAGKIAALNTVRTSQRIPRG